MSIHALYARNCHCSDSGIDNLKSRLLTDASLVDSAHALAAIVTLLRDWMCSIALSLTCRRVASDFEMLRAETTESAHTSSSTSLICLVTHVTLVMDGDLLPSRWFFAVANHHLVTPHRPKRFLRTVKYGQISNVPVPCSDIFPHAAGCPLIILSTSLDFGASPMPCPCDILPMLSVTHPSFSLPV